MIVNRMGRCPKKITNQNKKKSKEIKLEAYVVADAFI